MIISELVKVENLNWEIQRRPTGYNSLLHRSKINPRNVPCITKDWPHPLKFGFLMQGLGVLVLGLLASVAEVVDLRGECECK